MATIIQQNLFSWEEVERSSDLTRLSIVLETLPDEGIIQELERHRGKGRNTYPVRPCWNLLLAGIVFQHPTVESLLRELRRNGELRSVCGFNLVHGTEAAPTPSAMSRFLKNVMRNRGLIQQMFDELVEELQKLIPDFGQHLAFDGKQLESYSTGRRRRDTNAASDADADWGKKQYHGVDQQGKPWSTIKSWFGYQLHLIVDARYELPVAFEVMRASCSEATRLVPMVQQLAKRHPSLIKECSDLSADRGLDSGAINTTLWEGFKIKPVIDCRAMWKLEHGVGAQSTRMLRSEGWDNVTYTERGKVCCVCPVTGTEHSMAFRGFEASRNQLGYRCPAAAYGWQCQGREQCELAALGRLSQHGRIVRVSLDQDRRVFTPIPRDTPSWRRLYALRSSVERINARVDRDFGFERHTIRGRKKMETRMGLALVVMLAMAVGFARLGQMEALRSLVTSPRRKRAA